jgi:HPP family
VNTPPNHRAEHVFWLIARLRLSWLLAHLPPTFVWAASLCGFAAYKVTGMHAFPEGFGGEVYWPCILASGLALSLTGAIMVLLHVNHPPAGATTMIVSLGIFAKPGYLPVIEIAVVLLAAQAFAIDRLTGLPYPIWRSQTPHTGGPQ